MRRRPTARELEAAAASAGPPRHTGPTLAGGEVAAMLARRGFRPTSAPLDLPFPEDLEGEAADRLCARLGHYAFRLLLRGAIQRPEGFTPVEATRYLEASGSAALAESLVELGLADRVARGRYRLKRRARSFGGTLEWYVARELRRRFGFDAAAGLEFRAPGVGGDLDVVAAAEGKLVYLELKSSPPRHLLPTEVAGFFSRLRALRPHLALFVMDTALRLEDRVLPMLVAGAADAGTRSAGPAPRRVVREVWALTPHVYALNAKPDLMRNIGRALAEGLRALAPAPP